MATPFDQAPGEPVNCILCVPSHLSTSRIVTVLSHEFLSSHGFVARDDARKQIVVSFRGSLHFFDNLEDLDMLKNAWPPEAPGSYVHQGFLLSYLTVSKKMMASLESLLEGPNACCKGYDVIVGGHSLGAAHAILAAVDIHHKHPDWCVKAFPSGQPRIGNEAWAQYVSGLPMEIHRLTAGIDSIPKLPFYALGYRHHRGEVYWSSTGEWFACDGGPDGTNEDPNCIGGQPTTILGYLKDHIFGYLGFFGRKLDPPKA
ncbi:alpha/beta-hydrolase [Ramicandelaber brevisporus]|nr:alpha/beta-hydrolase [Ramicandelaber brevisporus]